MIEIFSDLIWGARISLYFIAVSLPLGFLAAIVMAFGLTSRGPTYYLASSYVYFFRGSPLFIQLYFFYFLARSLGVHKAELWGFEFDFLLGTLFIAPFVLFLNTTAYSAVIFANALRAVPKGDLEAAEAYGFSPLKKFWRITWPSMIRIAWPAYGLYQRSGVFVFEHGHRLFFHPADPNARG